VYVRIEDFRTFLYVLWELLKFSCGISTSCHVFCPTEDVKITIFVRPWLHKICRPLYWNTISIESRRCNFQKCIGMELAWRKTNLGIEREKRFNDLCGHKFECCFVAEGRTTEKTTYFSSLLNVSLWSSTCSHWPLIATWFTCTCKTISFQIKSSIALTVVSAVFILAQLRALYAINITLVNIWNKRKSDFWDRSPVRDPPRTCRIPKQDNWIRSRVRRKLRLIIVTNAL